MIMTVITISIIWKAIFCLGVLYLAKKVKKKEKKKTCAIGNVSEMILLFCFCALFLFVILKLNLLQEPDLIYAVFIVKLYFLEIKKKC